MNKTTHKGSLSLYEERILVLALIINSMPEHSFTTSNPIKEKKLLEAYKSMTVAIKHSTYCLAELINDKNEPYLNYIDTVRNDIKYLISKTN
jgi:hypothetical protein